MNETEKQEIEQAHAQNLQDEQKRQASKVEAERVRREKLDKDNKRKREWRAAKKAALEGAKAARSKPAAKAKAKSAPKAKGRKSKFDEASKITVLVEKNPKRPGTDSFRRFEKYRTGMTVADYIAKGGALPDLLWDIEHKFIKVG